MTPRGGTRGDRMLLGRMLAGMELLGRSGVGQVELAFDEDLPKESPTPVLWYCKGNWGGTLVISEHFPYPAQAVEDLVGRTLNGGHCRRCDRTTVVGVILDGPDYCCFTLTADNVDDEQSYRYVRTCEAGA